MRALALALLISLLPACLSTNVVRQESAATPKLDAAAAIYVAIPEDGAFGAKPYAGSGRATGSALADAFGKHAKRVCAATEPEPRERALARARELGCAYGVMPSITQWEDRLTEWSGRPDRIYVRLLLVEVATERELDSAVIEGRSSWFTFGGDHPEDLLAAPVAKYVDSLYASP